MGNGTLLLYTFEEDISRTVNAAGKFRINLKYNARARTNFANFPSSHIQHAQFYWLFLLRRWSHSRLKLEDTFTTTATILYFIIINIFFCSNTKNTIARRWGKNEMVLKIATYIHVAADQEFKNTLETLIMMRLIMMGPLQRLKSNDFSVVPFRFSQYCFTHFWSFMQYRVSPNIN